MVRYASGNQNVTFHASAVEVYFDDCFDLLNNKAKIPIAGQSAVKKKSNFGFDKKGAVHSMHQYVKPEDRGVDKDAYTAKGQAEI